MRSIFIAPNIHIDACFNAYAITADLSVFIFSQTPAKGDMGIGQSEIFSKELSLKYQLGLTFIKD